MSPIDTRHNKVNSDKNVGDALKGHLDLLLLAILAEKLAHSYAIDTTIVAEAEQRALQRFGSVRDVAASFYNGRIKLMQKLLIGLAVLMGWTAAYVDSRPTWDDMGVLLFGMLLAAGLIGLFSRRRPWLVGLAVGLWVPLYEISFNHQAGALIALAFALAGAYAGWALGQGFRRVSRPA